MCRIGFTSIFSGKLSEGQIEASGAQTLSDWLASAAENH
jgi:hypothetical protein